jgi:Flp pilus assembly protein TadG
MTKTRHWEGFCVHRSRDGGYVAVMTAMMLVVFMGFCAFAVDVGRWYVVGQQEQRAADAAALAGVTSLPSNPAGADASVQTFSKVNGFDGTAPGTTVTSGTDGRPTRLRVTVSRVVDNIFGPLLGVPKTTVTRTAVADYAGPVPMGSPCNGFGNDPEPGVSPVFRSSHCTSSLQFWANIGSNGENKQSGDAFQDGNCSATPIDNCSGTNGDYDTNGYIYTVTVTAPVTNLTIQAFDPAEIPVGDHCTAGNNLSGAAGLGSNAPVGVTNASTRYAVGDTTPATSAWCTGDRLKSGDSKLMKTQFTVRAPGLNAWDPVSWPVASCGVGGPANPRTFSGFSGDLKKALDSSAGTYQPEVGESFRRWVDLCTITGTVQPGTYAIQVQTNGPGADPTAGGHNRFGLRAFGASPTDMDNISVAGFNKMAIFANFSGTTQFFLARVPTTAAGQTLNVRLFDVGDGSTSGLITILKPTESADTFINCIATGLPGAPAALTKSLPSCQLTGVSSTNYQGRWQNVAVPIPSSYTCSDSLPTGCWVRLKYDYSGSPADATSWTASIDGDPVRLVE